MTEPGATVIIPTRNRPESLARTLSLLRFQDVPTSEYEIVVVDDGSVPPIVLPDAGSGPELMLVRLEESERSASRNAGAMTARGKLLVFVDDDVSVGSDFIYNHLFAHRRWPRALVVGSVRLPSEAMTRPFVRFRQGIDDSIGPRIPGPSN